MPDDACAPEVVSDPDVMSGDPVVAGTQVPALTIVAYLRAGHSDRGIHEDYPTLPPGAVDAVRRWAGERLGNLKASLHPIEDGPGSGTRVELSVRVLVGLERSTVIVADPLTGRALTREVLPHGREADVAAAAVEAAIRACLQAQQPAMDYSHRLLPDGTPRRPLDDAETARHMRARGFSEAEVRHVLGYDPGPPGGVPGGSREPLGEPRE